MVGSKEIFAKNLNTIMAKRDIDRNKLVEDLGLKYTTVADWTKGITYPRIDKIELLANYFGIKKSELIEGVDNNTISGDKNNVATMSGDINGNVTFGSGIDKNDLHDAVRHLSDRELQEKILDEMSELKASQNRLENAMAILIENQVNVLARINNVDSSFKELMKKD